MQDLVAELAERGRALTPQDRSRLIGLLVDSLDETLAGDTEEAWRLEIQRRMESLEKGEATLFDAEDVLAEARAIAP